MLNFPKDFSIYATLKDEYMIYNSQSYISLNCLFCNSRSHNLPDCPKGLIKIQPSKVIEEHSFDTVFNKRDFGFKRRGKGKICVFKILYQIKKDAHIISSLSQESDEEIYNNFPFESKLIAFVDSKDSINEYIPNSVETIAEESKDIYNQFNFSSNPIAKTNTHENISIKTNEDFKAILSPKNSSEPMNENFKLRKLSSSIKEKRLNIILEESSDQEKSDFRIRPLIMNEFSLIHENPRYFSINEISDKNNQLVSNSSLINFDIPSTEMIIMKGNHVQNKNNQLNELNLSNKSKIADDSNSDIFEKNHKNLYQSLTTYHLLNRYFEVYFNFDFYKTNYNILSISNLLNDKAQIKIKKGKNKKTAFRKKLNSNIKRSFRVE